MLPHCVRRKGGPYSYASHTLKGVWLVRCTRCAHAVPGLPQNSGYATESPSEWVMDEYPANEREAGHLLGPLAQKETEGVQISPLSKKATNGANGDLF